MWFDCKGCSKRRRSEMDENNGRSWRIQIECQWSSCWTCSTVKVPFSLLSNQWLRINELNPISNWLFRAHLNDLENILPHLFAGFFYVLTNPAVLTATLLFKVSAIARIVHTIVYAVVVIPQPARGTVWFVHYLITFYMAISVLLHCK